MIGKHYHGMMKHRKAKTKKVKAARLKKPQRPPVVSIEELKRAMGQLYLADVEKEDAIPPAKK